MEETNLPYQRLNHIKILFHETQCFFNINSILYLFNDVIFNNTHHNYHQSDNISVMKNIKSFQMINQNIRNDGFNECQTAYRISLRHYEYVISL